MENLTDEEINKINKVLPEEKKIKKPKTYKFIGCKNCGKTNTTLVKAKDSYYCKFCFDKLGKEKF